MENTCICFKYYYNYYRTIFFSTYMVDLFKFIHIFQVFFLNLQFYSPLPRAVLISREIDGSWETWQMYATDCRSYYGQTDNGPLPQPDSVNCLQFKRPVELFSIIQRYLTVFFVMGLAMF